MCLGNKYNKNNSSNNQIIIKIRIEMKSMFVFKLKFHACHLVPQISIITEIKMKTRSFC
jgi:hypothetical protein